MSSIAVERNEVSPANESHKPRRIKTGGRSGIVCKMLLSNRWATTSMAVFLPLIIGLIMTIMGLIAAAVHPYARIENYSTFFTENIIHQVVLSVAFASTAFMTVSKNLTLILGMGFTRKTFWRGFARASAVLAGIATGIYAAFALIETVTLGYSLGWQVMAPNFDGIFMFVDPWESQLLEFLRFAVIWFTLLFIVQMLGAFLALAFSRWGAVVTGICCLIFLGLLLVICREMFGTIYYDLGLHQLFYPYYYADNQQVYYTDILDIVAMMKNETAPTPLLPLPADVYYTGRFMVICLIGIVFTYALGAALLKKTDFR